MEIIDEILSKYPALRDRFQDSSHRAVFQYALKFIGDHSILAFSLCCPLRKEDETIIFPDFQKYYEILLKMYERDRSLLDRNTDGVTKQMKIIYLAIQKYFFDTGALDDFSTDYITYSLLLLDSLDISKLREDLEDIFFQKQDPLTYEHYVQLLSFSKKNFNTKMVQAKNALALALKNESVDVVIDSRIKSIFSIHRNILKKNILYSQVLDTIGLRIIVKNETECYQVLAVILKHWPLMNSKIKDYITLPKENGYKSIHLTLLFEGFPIEVQIRTIDMHHFAEYGEAAHSHYRRDFLQKYFSSEAPHETRP